MYWKGVKTIRRGCDHLHNFLHMFSVRGTENSPIQIKKSYKRLGKKGPKILKNRKKLALSAS